MRFGILGPLRIQAGDTETTLAAGRERTVLAVLLLYPNEVVPVERLAEAVWGADPPSTMRAQVHSCVSRLRRGLRRTGIDEDVVVTDPAGYLVRVAAADLDSLVFARAVAEGRTAAAAGRLEEARDRLRGALALWRGPALAGIGSRQVEIGASALEEQRSAALEDCIDVELRLGLAHELVGELTDVVERFPVRERLRGQLMVALYRVGRQADALAGAVHVRLGHFNVAVALLKRAAQLKPEVGNRYGAADTLSDLGTAYRGLGRLAEALACQREALELMRQVSDIAGECQILNDLGVTLRVVGELAEARAAPPGAAPGPGHRSPVPAGPGARRGRGHLGGGRSGPGARALEPGHDALHGAGRARARQGGTPAGGAGQARATRARRSSRAAPRADQGESDVV
jgi:DNA-binding SARP family transcriptional activator